MGVYSCVLLFSPNELGNEELLTVDMLVTQGWSNYWDVFRKHVDYRRAQCSTFVSTKSEPKRLVTIHFIQNTKALAN